MPSYVKVEVGGLAIGLATHNSYSDVLRSPRKLQTIPNNTVRVSSFLLYSVARCCAVSLPSQQFFSPYNHRQVLIHTTLLRPQFTSKMPTTTTLPPSSAVIPHLWLKARAHAEIIQWPNLLPQNDKLIGHATYDKEFEHIGTCVLRLGVLEAYASTFSIFADISVISDECWLVRSIT